MTLSDKIGQLAYPPDLGDVGNMALVCVYDSEAAEAYWRVGLVGEWAVTFPDVPEEGLPCTLEGAVDAELERQAEIKRAEVAR